MINFNLGTRWFWGRHVLSIPSLAERVSCMVGSILAPRLLPENMFGKNYNFALQSHKPSSKYFMIFYLFPTRNKRIN